MARQAGHIKQIGTLGGINYYIVDGIGYSRVAGGGFTREAIKNSPRMDRVRENNSEFGDTSAVKKLFRRSLNLFFGNQKDGTLHRKMMSVFMQIKDCDTTSVRGKRRVAVGLQTVEGKSVLAKADFTPYPLLLTNAVYDASNFNYTVNAAPLDFTYRNSATHVELCLGVVVFDFDEMSAKLFDSAPLIISKKNPLAHFSLSPTMAPSGNGTRITVLWHRYLQEVNGVLYRLKDKQVYGLKVLEVQ